MNKFLLFLKEVFLILILVCVNSLPMKSETRIKHPAYQWKSTEHFEVSEIIRTDTAVILKMDAYHLPHYWVSLSPTIALKGKTTGKEYKLVRSEGFALGEKIFMPASGNMAFSLQFEAVDPQDNVVDCTEGDVPGADHIRGLQLYKSKVQKKIHTRITGTVINRPQSSRLMLQPKQSSMTVTEWISIPIRDGRFSYDLYSDVEQSYRLVFWDEHLKGIMRDALFFAESGAVDFTLYPFEDNKPAVIDTKGKLNTEMKAFEKTKTEKFNIGLIHAEIDKLIENDGFSSDTMKAFWKTFEQTTDPFEKDKLYKERDRLNKSGEGHTQEAKVLMKKQDKLYNDMLEWELNYVKNQANPSVFCYDLIVEKTKVKIRERKEAEAYLELYKKKFLPKYPNHPYTDQMKLLEEATRVKVGNKYPNFSAPDLKGKMVTLSDSIAGKVALIDLWATWCGPCRRTSMSMIPVYEKYKGRGFTIIGVAGEREDTRQMKEVIKKDGYTWTNLAEINGANGIWLKYGIDNSAGGTFLVDRDGTILLINPTAEEVEQHLKKLL